ncbi:MAG TPA: response regulator [Nitrospiria bacterium]|jgi:DNA-binding response OmpR family regulator|nr:response regulator [Nitrospiria bacterium]
MAKKLLVVDSNLAIQKLVEYNLSREKFEVTCLNDGLSALDLLTQIDPDLILADFHLEGISFVRFCEKVKQKQTSKERAILVLVSGTDSYDPSTLVTLGVVDFVKKPLEPKELIEKLKDLSQDSATIIDRAPRPVVPATVDPPPPPPPSPTPTTAPLPPSKDQAEVMKIEELLGWSLPGEKSTEETQKTDTGTPEPDYETTVIQSRADATVTPPVPPEPLKEPSEPSMAELMPALEDSQTVIGLRTRPSPFVPPAPSGPADPVPPAPLVEPHAASLPALVPPIPETAPPQPPGSPETSAEPSPAIPPTGNQAQAPPNDAVPQEMIERLVSKMAKEILEKVAWDVVPSLAETLIKEELEKLKTEKPA